MNLLQHFIKNIHDQQLFGRSDRLLLAVSGGVDSVVLCELCCRAGFTFGIAHANFQLRGEESEGDEQFVRALASAYQVPVHVKLFETEGYALEKKVSIQVAARELRYHWFDELLTTGYRWLLTAHHAGDNTETMLMNFFRGTGISGLRGILPKSGNIVRPLLQCDKAEIIDFAREEQLQWREDSSNSSDKYSRNYFRHAVIPVIQAVYSGVEHNLKENAVRFREIEELYEQSIEAHKKKLIEKKGREVHIPVLKLKKTQPLRTVVYEIIKEYNFSAHQVPDVLQLTEAQHGKFVRSATHRMIRNRDWLIIAENEPEEAGLIIIEKGQADAGKGLLNIKCIDGNTDDIPASPLLAYMDARKIVYPLILRTWKQGDYFYPMGMRKKKKVSRFLIDQKLSPTQKEKVMVLESDKKICWVVGMRIDDRFKITPGTRGFVIFTLNQR